MSPPMFVDPEENWFNIFKLAQLSILCIVWLVIKCSIHMNPTFMDEANSGRLKGIKLWIDSLLGASGQQYECIGLTAMGITV